MFSKGIWQSLLFSCATGKLEDPWSLRKAGKAYLVNHKTLGQVSIQFIAPSQNDTGELYFSGLKPGEELSSTGNFKLLRSSPEGARRTTHWCVGLMGHASINQRPLMEVEMVSQENGTVELEKAQVPTSACDAFKWNILLRRVKLMRAERYVSYYTGNHDNPFYYAGLLKNKTLSLEGYQPQEGWGVFPISGDRHCVNLRVDDQPKVVIIQGEDLNNLKTTLENIDDCSMDG